MCVVFGACVMQEERERKSGKGATTPPLFLFLKRYQPPIFFSLGLCVFGGRKQE